MGEIISGKKKWFRVESLIFNLTDGFVFFGRSLIIVALKKFIQFVLKVKRKIPFRFLGQECGTQTEWNPHDGALKFQCHSLFRDSRNM